MTLGEIERWLKSRGSYAEGLTLYNYFGKNNYLKGFLAAEENATNREILSDKLKDCLATATAALPAPVIPVAKKKAPARPDFHRYSKTKFVKIDIEALPPELKEENVRKADLFREADFHHNRLELVTDAERLVSAKIIVENFDEIDIIWKKLEHYQRTKEYLKENKQPQTKLELFQEMKRLASRISKAKGKGDSVKVTALLEQKEKLQKLYDAIQE